MALIRTVNTPGYQIFALGICCTTTVAYLLMSDTTFTLQAAGSGSDSFHSPTAFKQSGSVFTYDMKCVDSSSSGMW